MGADMKWEFKRTKGGLAQIKCNKEKRAGALWMLAGDASRQGDCRYRALRRKQARIFEE